jgi:hypothetical protein
MGNCNQCLGPPGNPKRKGKRAGGKKGDKNQGSDVLSSLDIKHFSIMSVDQKVKRVGDR